jgi:hypothetical protein
MRIPQRHQLTRQYVTEFNLPLRKFVHSNPQAYYFIRGERQRIADVGKLNRLFALRPDEAAKTPDDLFAESVTKVLGTLSDAEKQELSAPDAHVGEGPRARSAIAAAVDGGGRVVAGGHRVRCHDDTARNRCLPSAATETLREEFLEVWSQGFDEIIGGTDRLPAALRAEIALPSRGWAVKSSR